MNSFLERKLAERAYVLEKSGSKDQYNKVFSIIKLMDNVGVSNEKDFRDFFYVTAHTKGICKDILGEYPDNEYLAKLSGYIYDNRNNYPINTIINFNRSVKNAIDNCGKTINKTAYPHGTGNNQIRPPHNLKKWLHTMKEIYAAMHKGYTFNDAFEHVTQEWASMEQKDFKNWLQFYQSNQHELYKTAQNSGDTFVGGPSGVQLPLGLKAKLPNVPKLFGDDDLGSDYIPKQNQKDDELIAKNKIIGRLNSAEKIFTSVNFKQFLGQEFEAWLSALHSLKRKIQSLKIANTSLIEDLIVLSSNQLEDQGFYKSATIMHKIAQTPPPPVVPTEQAAEPALEEPTPEFNMDDIGMEEFGMGGEGKEEEEGVIEDEGEQAMLDFLKNLGASTDEDDNDSDDEKTAYDNFDGALISLAEDGFGKIAQEAPPEMLSVPEKTLPEVPMKQMPEKDTADEAIEKALANVTYSDIIVKLEDIATMLKVRHLTRELTIVDLMMQSMGVSSFFPNMGEATKSALDSNQYVLSRVEDILAKLRGASDVSDGSLEEIKEKFHAAEENNENKRKIKEQDQMKPQALEGDLGTEVEPGIAAPKQAPTELPSQPASPLGDELKQPTKAPEQQGEGIRI